MPYTKYTNTNLQKTPPARRSAKKRLFLLAAVLVAAGGTLATLELTDTTYLLHKKPVAQTSDSAPKGPANADQSAKQDAPATTSPSPAVPGSSKQDVKVPGTTSPNVKLLAPSGTFANEYSVTLGEQLASTCTTNAGVYCKITFTKDGTSESLSKQLTDSSGNAFWSWKPKDIGLTSGTWHIEAVANYGSQTKITNNDPLTLEIK